MVWRRLLRVLWTARGSNQSMLKEISPEYSFEGLMLKLKLQYFDHLMRRTDSLEKTLMLEKIDDGRRRGWQRMKWLAWHHWLYGSEFEQALGVGYGLGSLACYSPWYCKETDTTERMNWTERDVLIFKNYICEDISAKRVMWFLMEWSTEKVDNWKRKQKN